MAGIQPQITVPGTQPGMAQNPQLMQLLQALAQTQQPVAAPVATPAYRGGGGIQTPQAIDPGYGQLGQQIGAGLSSIGQSIEGAYDKRRQIQRQNKLDQMREEEHDAAMWKANREQTMTRLNESIALSEKSFMKEYGEVNRDLARLDQIYAKADALGLSPEEMAELDQQRIDIYSRLDRAGLRQERDAYQEELDKGYLDKDTAASYQSYVDNLSGVLGETDPEEEVSLADFEVVKSSTDLATMLKSTLEAGEDLVQTHADFEKILLTVESQINKQTELVIQQSKASRETFMNIGTMLGGYIAANPEDSATLSDVELIERGLAWLVGTKQIEDAERNLVMAAVDDWAAGRGIQEEDSKGIQMAGAIVGNPVLAGLQMGHLKAGLDTAQAILNGGESVEDISQNSVNLFKSAMGLPGEADIEAERRAVGDVTKGLYAPVLGEAVSGYIGKMVSTVGGKVAGTLEDPQSVSPGRTRSVSQTFSRLTTTLSKAHMQANRKMSLLRDFVSLLTSDDIPPSMVTGLAKQDIGVPTMATMIREESGRPYAEAYGLAAAIKLGAQKWFDPSGRLKIDFEDVSELRSITFGYEGLIGKRQKQIEALNTVEAMSQTEEPDMSMEVQ